MITGTAHMWQVGQGSKAPAAAACARRAALLLCVLLACVLGLAIPAYAAEPEFDGDASKLDNVERGRDWMTGISGDRLLSDVVLPGSSGAASSSLFLAGQTTSGNWDPNRVKSQNRTIAQQLTDGVRLFELHLTAQDPGVGWVGGKDTLWVAEQVQVNGQKGMCYAQDASGNAISLKKAINYMRSFLNKNPFETVVIVLSETDDAATVFRNLRAELDDFKNYLYLGSAMPKMKDVRGKVVVCTTHPELLGENGGLSFPARGTTATSSIGGTQFSSLTVTNGAEAQGLSFTDSVPLTGDAHASHSNVVYAGIAAFGENEPTPREHANQVNPVLFGDGGTFATRGTLYGWVLSAFMDSSHAKQLWMANFPDGLEYWTAEFWTRQPEVRKIAQTNILKGASAYSPAVENLPGRYLDKWVTDDGTHAYKSGEAIPIGQNGTKLWATWGMSWASLQSWLLKQGGEEASVTLESNLVATKLDETLYIPPYANVTINLAGHTLDRGLSGQSVADAEGSVVRVAPGATLKLKGGGTIKGGHTTGVGGGVCMTEESTLVLEGVTIRDNIANGGGAGVYVPYGATLQVSGNAKVTDNKAKYAGNPVASNVFLDEDVRMTVAGALADEALIGVTTYTKPESGSPLAFTQGLEGNGGASNFSSDDRAYLVGLVSNEATITAGVEVAFDTVGGSAEDSQIVAEGTPAMRPHYTPSKYEDERLWVDDIGGKYEFLGWYADAAYTQPWDFDTPVTQSMTLYAKWGVNYVFKTDTVFNVGGSAVDRVTKSLELGQKLDASELPITRKAGYELDGWTYKRFRGDTVGQKFDFANTPASVSLVFEPRWKKSAHPQYTVRFDARGGEPSVTTLEGIEKGDLISPPDPAPTLEGHTLEGWYKDSYCRDKWNFETDTVTKDRTLYAKWTPNTFTVAFDLDGGNEPAPQSQTVAYEQQATRPTPDPTRNGYRFSGWYYEKAPGVWDFYMFTQLVRGDLTLRASWTKLHAVTLNANGGTVSPTFYEVRDGRSVSYEHNVSQLPVPTWSDDTRLFAGWYYFDNSESNAERPFGRAYRASDAIREDTTVIAKWIRTTPETPNTHTVTFDSAGGEEVPSQEIGHGGYAVEPAPLPPRDEYYEFGAWYVDGVTGPYQFQTTPVTSDLVLRAQWSLKECEVTVMNGYSDEVLECYKMGYGRTTTAPTDPPQREGYVFKEWGIVPDGGGEPVPYDFETPVKSDITLVALWSKVHAVTFDSKGGSDVGARQAVDGEPVAEPDQAPTKAGNTFAHWYVSDPLVSYDFSTPVTGDLTLCAAWATYDVSFDADGGMPAPPAQTVALGNTAERPEDPTKEGSRFAGWYVDDSNGASHAYDFSVPVTCDLVLTAHWVEVAAAHKVEFDINGGTSSAIDSQNVADGACATRPQSDPTREGYDFVGWFELMPRGFIRPEDVEGDPGLESRVWFDNDDVLVLYDFDTPVVANTTLRARWRQTSPLVVTHTVSFDSRGGSELSPVVRKHGEPLGTVSQPIRKGYTFQGWKNADGTSCDPSTTQVNDNMTLYADWSQDELRYSVDFDPNNGEAVSRQEVEPNAQAQEPSSNPTYEGHEFDGWFEALPEGHITRAEAEDSWGSDPDFEDKVHFDKIDGKERVLRRYDFATPVTHDLELRAEWTASVLDVTFVSGADVVDEQKVAWGSKATPPQEPYRFGYTFTGWFSNEGLTQKFDLDSPVKSSLTLYAGFSQNSYTVAFDAAGGSSVGTQTVAHGGHAAQPADPVWEGHEFLGWFEKDATDPFDFATTQILSDLTLYARWDGWDTTPAVTYGVHTSIVNGDGAPVVSQRKGSFDAVSQAMFAEEAARQDVYVTLTSSALEQSEVNGAERALVQARLSELGARAGVWFDLSLAKRLGSYQAEPVAVDSTDQPLKLRVAVPENVPANKSGTTRTYYVLRIHEGAVDVLGSGAGASLDIQSDRFSTYVFAYADKGQTTPVAPAVRTTTASGGTVGASTGTAARQASPLTGDRMPITASLVLGAVGVLLVACGRHARRSQ